MKIGFIGTGKLGLPVSLVYNRKGHDILAFDVNPNFYNGNSAESQLYSEELCPENKRSLNEWLSDNHSSASYAHTKDLKEIVNFADIIFVAVQTPHKPQYEGTMRLTPDRDDFDYSYLRKAIEDLSGAVNEVNKSTVVVIISTVLPGTIRREIIPVMSQQIKLCYNPYFIAMGTVAYDCIHPEFILLGNHDEDAKNLVTDFYKTITNSPVFATNLENAEMIKVSYNTFIGTKIALANNIMEICHSLPNLDCDVITRALSMANHRLISGAYLTGGMGDGGGCHPRDNIALSWLSNKLGVEFNFFDAIMTAREKQTDFLANLIVKEHQISKLPVVILGASFKPNTAICTGSPAVLLSNILKEKSIEHNIYDPYNHNNEEHLANSAIFFIACSHEIFNSLELPSGSTLIDPHRKYSTILKEGKYIPVGKDSNLK